jgi:hypothetical protein
MAGSERRGKKKQEETFRIQIEIFLKKMCRGININNKRMLESW